MAMVKLREKMMGQVIVKSTGKMMKPAWRGFPVAGGGEIMVVPAVWHLMVFRWLEELCLSPVGTKQQENDHQ